MNVTKKLIFPFIFVLAFIAPQAGASEWYGDVTLGIGFTDAENGGIRQNAVVTRPMESSDTSTPLGLRKNRVAVYLLEILRFPSTAFVPWPKKILG